MHHPHDNKSLLIAGSELVVLVVPLNDLNLARVPLQVLVHRKISTTLALARVKLQDLQKALVTTTSNVTLLLVPSDHIQVRAVRHSDLNLGLLSN